MHRRADDPCEMMVGAVLVQNTAWRNVERAVAALRRGHLLDWERLAATPEEELAAVIRPAGTYRVKARRVRALAHFVTGHGGLERLARLDPGRLRAGLLAVHGIGPETADAILVYAFGHPSVVLDGYTRRITSRLGWFPDPHPRRDGERRQLLASALPADAAVHGECHALLVALAKAHCGVRPRCDACPLRGDCRHARDRLSER